LKKVLVAAFLVAMGWIMGVQNILLKMLANPYAVMFVAAVVLSVFVFKIHSAVVSGEAEVAW